MYNNYLKLRYFIVIYVKLFAELSNQEHFSSEMFA